jgi:cytochrome c
MKKRRQPWLVFITVILLLGIVVGGRYLIQQRSRQQISVTVPRLSPAAKAGEAAFMANCAGCHGINAAGSDKGPPLIDPIYRSSHHGDFSFVRAVTLGVPQHHWVFGAMPAQPQVTREQIDQIVIYIREIQGANGIN